MASGKKIATEAAGRMTSSPFIAWLRGIFLRTKRMDKYQKTMARDEFVNAQRYPADQSSRSQPPPNVPGGIHHRLAQNYYLEHDARRAVDPPKVVSSEGKLLVQAAEAHKLSVAVGPQVSLGPAQNFGLPAKIPTPGFGSEWKRNQDGELPTQQNDEEFTPLQRYDSYRRSTTAQ